MFLIQVAIHPVRCCAIRHVRFCTVALVSTTTIMWIKFTTLGGSKHLMEVVFASIWRWVVLILLGALKEESSFVAILLEVWLLEMRKRLGGRSLCFCPCYYSCSATDEPAKVVVSDAWRGVDIVLLVLPGVFCLCYFLFFMFLCRPEFVGWRFWSPFPSGISDGGSSHGGNVLGVTLVVDFWDWIFCARWFFSLFLSRIFARGFS